MLILVWTKVSKSHAYDKSDSSRGFVKIENEQIKTVHVLVDKTGVKLLIFIGEKVNNKQQGKTWSRGATSPLPFAGNLTLNLSIIEVIKFPYLRFFFFKKNPTLAYLILSK